MVGKGTFYSSIAVIFMLCLSCSVPQPSGEIHFRRDSFTYRIPARGGEPEVLDSIAVRDPFENSGNDTLISGEWMAFIDESKLWWIPREGIEPIQISGDGEIVENFDISRENGIAAYSFLPEGGRTRIIIVKSIPDGRILALFDSDRNYIFPSIGPDGFYIVFQSGDGSESEIYIGSLINGKARFLATGEKPLWQ